jgi:hypothetical protein
MNMSLRHFLPLVAALLVAPPLLAQEKPRWVLEQAVEAHASSILLPAGASGMLVVKRCATCAPQSFVTSPRTRYFVEDTAIALADLRKGLAAVPAAFVTVLYDSRTHEVTRVVAGGTLAAAADSRVKRPGRSR